MSQRTLFLASRSPRRRELLAQIGVAHALIDVDIVEVVGADESPLDYVERVAREKAQAGWCAISKSESAIVLAADTEVVVDGHVFGKPADRAAAATMLRQLSGRTHQVLSAVVVCDHQNIQSIVSVSSVQFSVLADRLIERYLDTEEWMGKAGGYAIQGFAACFIERIEGSYSGIMGLPLFETSALIERFGAGPRA